MLRNVVGAFAMEVTAMHVSVCKFQIRGRLLSLPKVIRKVDKHRIEYLSAIVSISVPRVVCNRYGICESVGSDVISIAAQGRAAAKIETEAVSSDQAWRRGDLIEVTGYIVADSCTAGTKDSFGRPLPPSYRLQTNNPANIVNYSAYERMHKKAKRDDNKLGNTKITTITHGRRNRTDRIPLHKAVELNFYDFD